jgi:hypothetical protein
MAGSDDESSPSRRSSNEIVSYSNGVADLLFLSVGTQSRSGLVSSTTGTAIATSLWIEVGDLMVVNDFGERSSGLPTFDQHLLSLS